MFNIGDKLTDENYSNGAVWCNENNAQIVQEDDGYYIREIPEPTIEEQNEEIRQKREQAYQETSDHLKQDYDEALARGEADAEEKKQLWLASKDKIREENPYVVESKGNK